jgi:endonuclease/exonuclease/phosphatase family metal-dependent hydrolase
MVMNEPNEDNGGKLLRIRQQNICKSLEGQLEALNNFKECFDIICFQEQHFDFQNQSQALQNWYTIYPTKGERSGDLRQRSMLLINKNIKTSLWKQIDVKHKDITAIEIRTGNNAWVRIFNIYNDCKNSDAIASLQEYLGSEEGRDKRGREGENRQDMWMGDFNRHHPMWDKAENNQLFTRKNLDEAEQLINLAAEHGMEMVLPPGEPTRRDWTTRNTTRPDNVFCSEGLAETIVRCETHPEETPPMTDHFPIDTTFQIDVPRIKEEERRNFRGVDWEAFGKKLARKMEGRQWDEEVRTPEELEERVRNLEKAITDTIEDNVPVFKIHTASKRWWTRELAQKRKEYNRIARRSHALRDQEHAIHETA